MEEWTPEMQKEARRMQIETPIHLLRGTRYYDLAREVLTRLPERWDLYRTYTFQVEASPPPRHGDRYADSYREGEDDETRHTILESREEQMWVITLYEKPLSSLSDAAVKSVIAHELGHVASGMPCGSVVIEGIPYTKAGAPGGEEFYRPITPEERNAGEKIADAITRAWGFWEEEEAWFEEASRDRPTAPA